MSGSGSTEELIVLVKLSSHDMGVFESYTKGMSQNPHHVHDVMTTMISQVSRSKLSTANKFSMLFHDKIGVSLDDALKVCKSLHTP